MNLVSSRRDGEHHGPTRRDQFPDGFLPGHFFTMNTRFVSPVDVAVMLAEAFPVDVNVTVNWVLRFVGEPEPVTLTGCVDKVNSALSLERLMTKGAAVGTLSKASRTSMLALKLPLLFTANGDVHATAPLLIRQFESTIFEPAAPVMVSVELGGTVVTEPTVAVSV